MANNISLGEWLSQAQRGIVEGVNQFGPEFLRKQSYFTVDSSTNIFTTNYGKNVWHALNNQTRFFNAVPRVVWGTTAGWRVRTDRGSGRSRPVTETGTLPTVDVSDIQVVSSLPRIVATTFGVSNKSIFATQLEGGLGDVLAFENENAQIDHVKEINEEITAASASITSTGGATSFTVPAAFAHHFKVGDSVSQWDTSADAWIRTSGSAISAVNTGTGAVTVASSTTFADGDGAAIYSRAGFTSIDDIVSYDGWNFGGVDDSADFAGDGGVRSYDLTFGGRASDNWNAGYVQDNDGVGRELTLNLIDNAISTLRQRGGEPKLIMLGHDQYFKFERLLSSQQRYLGQEEYQVGVGNERTFPGTRTGLVLATYHGIPILPENDTAKSVSSADAVLGSNIYVLDTDYLELAIAQPTQYVENRDYFAANAMVVRGLLYTMGELRCTNMFPQAKITDLSA